MMLSKALCHPVALVDPQISVIALPAQSVVIATLKSRCKLCRNASCFSCSRVFPVTDQEHARECVKDRLHQAVHRGKLGYEQLCIMDSASRQTWKHARIYCCPVLTCLDPDWHRSDENDWLAGVALITQDSKKLDRPELGRPYIVAFEQSHALETHLASHFFECKTKPAITPSAKAAGATEELEVSIRVPSTLQEGTT